jgi:phosphoserine phosphatase
VHYVHEPFARHNLALKYGASYAYADSYSDLGLFELVGRPVAVYPDRKLAAHAAAKGWPVLGRAAT